MKKHWTVGNKRRRDGTKLYWRTPCGKWLRLRSKVVAS